MFISILLLLQLINGIILSEDDCCEDYCHSRDDEPYLYFGTKTAYEFIHGRRETPLAPYCTPVQIWMVIRHGASLPNKKILTRFDQLQNLKNEIVDNYEKYGSSPSKGGLCYQDLTALRNWYWNNSMTTVNEQILSEQGINDLKYLARRLKNVYPELLQSNNIENYLFRHTDDLKGKQSFQAFTHGWFDYYADRVKAVSNLNDSLIQSHKFCYQWNNEVKQLEDDSEYKNYLKSDRFKKLIHDVSIRLGFKMDLNESVIFDMYDACRYEKSWYINRISAWCTIFTKEQLKTLEFLQDLYYYYKSGYGNQLNRNIGCPLIKDMMDRFGRISSGAIHEPKAIVYFTPSTTLFQVLVALGINEDANSLKVIDEKRSRIWRTSLMNPFGANFAATLYKCEQGDRFRLSFILNERNIKHPEFLSGLISWFDFRRKFQQNFADCNLNEFCHNSAIITSIHFITIIYIIILQFLL